jgi:hypothetical protein
VSLGTPLVRWPVAGCHADQGIGDFAVHTKEAAIMSDLFLKLQSVPSRSHGVDHRFCFWQGNLKWSAGAARFKSTGGPTLWFQSSRTIKSASGTLLRQFGSRRCAC